MNITAHKKSDRIIFALFFLVVFFSLVVSIISYAIRKDFTLYAKIQCDPETSNCFEETCTEGNGQCLAFNHENGQAYFHIAYFNANDADECTTSECIDQLCAEGKCLIFECTEENQSLLETENSCDTL